MLFMFLNPLKDCYLESSKGLNREIYVGMQGASEFTMHGVPWTLDLPLLPLLLRCWVTSTPLLASMRSMCPSYSPQAASTPCDLPWWHS